MPAYVEVIGNLLQNPEQRPVSVKGEDRLITELRVYSDVYKRDPDDETRMIQDDAKCDPYNVTIWNERMGTEIMKLLRKGARVRIAGEQTLQKWDDKETGMARFALHIDAETCDLRLNRIEEIRFRARRVES